MSSKTKQPKFYNSLRFKLTLLYSVILFLFTSLFVFAINAYLNVHFRMDPPIAMTQEIPIQIPQPQNLNFDELPQEEKDRIKNIRVRDLKTIQQISVISLIPLALCSFALGYYVSGNFLNPLTHLKIQIDQLKDKHLGRQLPVQTNDEIGALIESFNDMSIRLKKSFDSQSQFVQDASHELRTPLTVIHTNLDTVLDDPKATPKELREAITGALNGIKNLTRLTNYLLELSRSNQNQRKDSDLGVLINEQFRLLKNLAENEKVALTTELPQDPVIRKIDKLMFGEAIYNLIDNAIKYSKSVKNPVVNVKLQDTNDETLIFVHDNGVGIPKEHQKHIFERFYRIDKSRNKATGGFGLGLAIVKKIVEDHEGRLSVNSKPGDTEFKIVLPH